MRPLVLFVLLATGCASARSPAPSGPAAPGAGRNEAQAVVLRFVDCFERLDLPGFLELFSDDASVFFPFADHPLRIDGKPRIGEGFGALFEEARRGKTGPRYLRLEPSELEIRLSGEAALATFHLRSGAQVARRTMLLERRAGRYRIAHLHASNLRMPDPAAAAQGK